MRKIDSLGSLILRHVQIHPLANGETDPCRGNSKANQECVKKEEVLLPMFGGMPQ